MGENHTNTACSFLSVDFGRILGYFENNEEYSSEGVVAIILALFISCGNGVVFLAIVRRPSLRTPANLLICGLSLADFLIGFICLPLYASLTYNKSCLLFAFTFFIGWTVCIASFLTMVAVSCERYLALFYSLKYPSIVTAKRIASVKVVVWALALLGGCSVFLPRTPSGLSIRYGIFGSFTTAGLVIIFGTYTRIFKLVRRHHHQINAQQIGDTNNARQRKLAVTMAYVTAISFLCYLPSLIVLVTVVVQGDFFQETARWFYISTLLFSSSSLLNPLIYCFRNQDIRCAVLNLLRDAYARPC